MLFNTPLATAVLAALVGGPAGSSATPLAKRDCTTEYPQSIGFPVNYNMTTTRKDAADFEVPAGATGCELAFVWPADYAGISYSVSDQINIVDLGTSNVVAQSVAVRAADQPTTVVLAQLPCTTLMSYFLEVPAESDPNAWVAFTEVLGAGLVVNHDCSA